MHCGGVKAYDAYPGAICITGVPLQYFGNLTGNHKKNMIKGNESVLAHVRIINISYDPSFII